MLNLSKTNRAEFEIISRTMMRFLNENCHPHVSVIITPTDAELLEGVCATGRILDHVKD